MNLKVGKTYRSILLLTATLGLLPASSWLSAATATTQSLVADDLASNRNAIAQIDPNNMYTPDFMMSASAQRALEIRLQSMRRNKGKGTSNNKIGRSPTTLGTTNSNKQVITAKQYQYIIKRMQQKMPGRDAEVKQMLDRMVVVRN